jgi:hypothetical protein
MHTERSGTWSRKRKLKSVISNDLLRELKACGNSHCESISRNVIKGMTGSIEDFGGESGKGVATCEDQGVYIKLINGDS